jgi:hypothetical protein
LGCSSELLQAESKGAEATASTKSQKDFLRTIRFFIALPSIQVSQTPTDYWPRTPRDGLSIGALLM